MVMPSGYQAIPNWFAPTNKGASVAVGDVTGSGKPDLVVLAVDAATQPNRAAYRLGRDLDTMGAVNGWSGWLPVPGWSSNDTQGAGIALADVNGNGRLHVIVLIVDKPAPLNT